MPSIDELRPLVAEPREDLAAEYKGWLNLTEIRAEAKTVGPAMTD